MNYLYNMFKFWFGWNSDEELPEKTIQDCYKEKSKDPVSDNEEDLYGCYEDKDGNQVPPKEKSLKQKEQIKEYIKELKKI